MQSIAIFEKKIDNYYRPIAILMYKIKILLSKGRSFGNEILSLNYCLKKISRVINSLPVFVKYNRTNLLKLLKMINLY